MFGSASHQCVPRWRWVRAKVLQARPFSIHTTLLHDYRWKRVRNLFSALLRLHTNKMELYSANHVSHPLKTPTPAHVLLMCGMLFCGDASSSLFVMDKHPPFQSKHPLPPSDLQPFILGISSSPGLGIPFIPFTPSIMSPMASGMRCRTWRLDHSGCYGPEFCVPPWRR
jgi:hypothetical protein